MNGENESRDRKMSREQEREAGPGGAVKAGGALKMGGAVKAGDAAKIGDAAKAGGAVKMGGAVKTGNAEADAKLVRLPAPLFRDPIYDCPTDPSVIWCPEEALWYLFYTQRRASGPEIGVSWVHGTKIGVATSRDGARWLYRGTLEGLEIERGHNTFWAPEIIRESGRYHMYVSYITGIPADWEEPRKILYYTSENLWDWKFENEIDLHSSRVIDACVCRIGENVWKMWYKDEEHGSMTCAAVSSDLKHWTVTGEEIHDCAQEGPNVFCLNGKKWMISDYWNGLAVYRSEDFAGWERCPDILREPGKRPMDCGYGHHADVVTVDNRAYIFYFCHPFWKESEGGEPDGRSWEKNRAVVQAAELVERDGCLECDRNAEVWFPLRRPQE